MEPLYVTSEVVKWCSCSGNGCFSKKVSIELQHGPTIPCFGTYLKELKAETQSGICTDTFKAALFKVAQRGKEHKPLTYKWIKEMGIQWDNAGPYKGTTL